MLPDGNLKLTVGVDWERKTETDFEWGLQLWIYLTCFINRKEERQVALHDAVRDLSAVAQAPIIHEDDQGESLQCCRFDGRNKI